jgi:hypothetical protein
MSKLQFSVRLFGFQTLLLLDLSGRQLIALTICVASQEKRDSLEIGLDTTAIPILLVFLRVSHQNCLILIVRRFCKATTDKAARSEPAL